MKPLYFRVIYGYNPNDYIAIDDNDLEKAMYLWRTNGIFSKDGKSIKGNSILRVEKDFRKYTGWYDSYTPIEGDDFAQMKRDCPDEKLFTDRINLANARLTYFMKNNCPRELLSTPESIDKLRLN